MKMINDRAQDAVKSISLYLSPREAEEMRDGLNRLLQDPEAKEHFHVYSDDNKQEISCSIITDVKLKDLSSFNKHERKVLFDE